MTNPAVDTPNVDLSTTVENPVEKLLAELQTDVTPSKALAYALQLLHGLTEAMPEDTRERLTLASKAVTGDNTTEAARAREIASQRYDASTYRNRAGLFEARAEAFEAMTPDEWRLHVAKREAEQAKRGADRQQVRDGAISVDITTEITETVRVEREEMEAAGWHHESTCTHAAEEAMAGVVTVDEAAAMRAATHHALQDWHDRAHGLTSWANCPAEPCKLLPEAAKVFKIGGGRI